MRKTLIYFIILIFCLSFPSCINNQSGKVENRETVTKYEAQNRVRKESVVISGEIRNASQKWITLLLKDAITGKKSYTEPIDENGNFQFSIELAHAQDLFIFYTSMNYIFCIPGDSIQLYFNGERFIDSLTFKGVNAKNTIQLYSFLDKIDFARLRQFRNINYPVNKFTELANNYEKECLSLISDIDPCEDVASWMNTYVRFVFAQLRYDYAIKNNFNTENNFFDFLKVLDSLDMDIRCCSESYDFIDQYYKFQIKEAGIDKDLQQAYNNDNYLTFISKNINYVSKNPTALNKIALARTMLSIIDLNCQIVDSLFNDYSNVVQNEYLSEVIQEEIRNYKDNLAGTSSIYTLDSLSNNEIVGTIFKEIAMKNRNKVLYIDFWGIFCKYCIDEFSASTELSKELEGKDIEFLYFCAPTDKERQQQAIKKYHLDGQHFLLSKDQMKTLNSIFNFTALPTYMIVDKQGRFIDTNAKKPSSNKMKQILLTLANK